jgi:hypothetical protein
MPAGRCHGADLDLVVRVMRCVRGICSVSVAGTLSSEA